MVTQAVVVRLCIAGDHAHSPTEQVADGSRGLDDDKGIGDQPMPFGAWEKLQLGWLDYDVVRAGRTETHKLRPGQAVSGTNPNGMVVLLPNKNVPLELGAPCADCGSRYYYSDQGNNINTTA